MTEVVEPGRLSRRAAVSTGGALGLVLAVPTPAAASLGVDSYPVHAPETVLASGSTGIRNVKDAPAGASGIPGAAGDGTTDDAGAIQQHLDTMGDATVLYFPPGRYRIEGKIEAKGPNHVTLRGAGGDASVLVAGPTSESQQLPLLITRTAGAPSSLAVEDLGFDLRVRARTDGITARGGALVHARISRCRFFNLGGTGVNLTDGVSATIEDCSFESLHRLDPPQSYDGVDEGVIFGEGIAIVRSVGIVRIQRNRFWLLKRAVKLPSAPTGAPDAMLLSDNVIDMAWYLSPPRIWGEQGVLSNETRSSDGFRSGAASFRYLGHEALQRGQPEDVDFTDLQAVIDRIHGDVTTGKRNWFAVAFEVGGEHGIASPEPSSVELVGASSLDLVRGDLILSGDAWTTVAAAVVDGPRVPIDGWRARSTCEPVPPPATSELARPCRVWIGKWRSMTQTGDQLDLEVDVWRRLDGRHAPSSETPVTAEVMRIVEETGYPIHGDMVGVHAWRNTIRRGCADLLSLWGGDGVVCANHLADGQDMGITIHGRHNVVAENRVERPGASAITGKLSDSAIVHNAAVGPGPVFNNTGAPLGFVAVTGGEPISEGLGSGNLVARNHVDGASGPVRQFGITLRMVAPGTIPETMESYAGRYNLVWSNALRRLNDWVWDEESAQWSSVARNGIVLHTKDGVWYPGGSLLQNVVDADGELAEQPIRYFDGLDEGWPAVPTVSAPDVVHAGPVTSPAGPSVVAGPGSSWSDTASGHLWRKRPTAAPQFPGGWWPTGAREPVRTSASGLEVSLAGGAVQDVALTASGALMLTGLSEAAAGVAQTVTLVLRQDATGGRVVSFPVGTKWPRGEPMVQGAAPGVVDVVTLLTLDAGATWLAFPSATDVAGEAGA